MKLRGIPSLSWGMMPRTTTAQELGELWMLRFQVHTSLQDDKVSLRVSEDPQCEMRNIRTKPRALKRRMALSCMLMASMVGLSTDGKTMPDEEEIILKTRLKLYIDEEEGFVLLRPAQWIQVDKAGANVLFEDPTSKGNNIGVVVNPVRIGSLKDFGSVDDVAEKLLQAERKKPSTNDAQLIQVKERQIHGDVPLYQLEYKLDSTRGVKRVLSAVTVASSKLYILNIAYTDSPQKPLLPNISSALQQILDSFDLLK